jgi:NAD(P)H-hydrate repair Nnr-like enzyme with NAD(P)H-hydrate epimerase domain
MADEFVVTAFNADGSVCEEQTAAEVVEPAAALFSTLAASVVEVATSVGYITVADVDALLGAGWQGQGDAARAVRMANAWLRERIKVVLPTTIPAEVIEAGAEIAKEAAAGKLYTATGREVTSTDVSAKTGTYAKATYAAGSVARTAGETYALALIAPWTRRSSAIFLERS